MEIHVTCRSIPRKELLEKCAKFYAKVLNLEKSRFVLNIKTVSDLRKKRYINGEVFGYEKRKISMLLESRLSLSQLLLTLAHEMVHVKQIAKGQYTGRLAKNGRILACWRGKIVKTVYLKRPWEIEATNRQNHLYESLIQEVARNMGQKEATKSR